MLLCNQVYYAVCNETQLFQPNSLKIKTKLYKLIQFLVNCIVRIINYQL